MAKDAIADIVLDGDSELELNGAGITKGTQFNAACD